MNTENRYQETDLGNVSPNPRGEYTPGTEYEYLDLVTFDGGSYICVAELGTTTSISPESGKSTDFWQCMTIPGDMTPEYVAMHDRVVNLSEQVEADAEEVRTAEQNVSGMKENVTQMQEQTRQSANLAEQSKDSAAGYAASADASRQAAETSEQNINAQVTGFDAHVDEKTSESNQIIEAARIAANKAILAQQEQSVNEVARVGGTAVSEAQAAARVATEKASAASESEKNAKASETAAKLSETNATKMAEQVAADKEQVANDIANLKLGVEPMWGDIPKIFFGGALQQTKDEAVVPFRYISKTADISGYAEIKAQGTSSMNYPKKNQTVKLFSDPECSEKLKIDFAGWGKQNKYCYKANWIDLSHARNVVSARLWADVVKSRSNYAELPEELRTSPNQGAIDGFPIKVYANGVYQGRYTLNIPKDKWAFNMDDVLDNHCVLCGENYVSGCFRAAANINGSDWTDEIHDVVPTTIKTRWNEVISFVMNSTDEEFKANLSDYFDVSSLIDYHLFGLQSCGLDAYGKNQLYMTYDGVKWIASMYDMDSTWGLYWDGSRFLATDYARTSYEDFVDGRSGNLLYIRLEQLFYTELKTRWLELKTGALSIDNIINRFEQFTDIASPELVKEDFATTTGGGKFTCIPSQSTNNIQQIRAFALARQAWTDEYIFVLAPEYSLAEATTFDGVDDYVDTGIKLYDIAKDFTILVEADLTQSIGNMETVFHAIYEAEPWPGVNLYHGYDYYNVGGNANSDYPYYVTGIPSSTTKIAIRARQGCVDRVSYLNNGEVTTVNITDGVYNAHDGNLLLGCYQDTTGKKDRFWTGTVSRFDVYFVALSDSKIETLLTE